MVDQQVRIAQGDASIHDLVQLASDWLKVDSGLPSDIYPSPSGDGRVDLLDFGVVAENWAE